MLRIRLARVGKRGHATFRIVVTEHTRPPKSGSLRTLGSYDPHTSRVQVNADLVQHYLAHGAQVSPTVHNLLVDQGVLTASKVAARKFPKQEAPAAPAGPSAAPEVGAVAETTEDTPPEAPGGSVRDEKDP